VRSSGLSKTATREGGGLLFLCVDLFELCLFLQNLCKIKRKQIERGKLFLILDSFRQR